jgi:fatty-acyl-CoA synthase
MTFAAHDWVDYHARHRPDALALASVEDKTGLTWSELDSRVGRLARVLSAHGVKKGDRVALIAENDPRVFETQFAAMRLGALFMPLNWRLVVAELSDIALDAEPSIIVHDAEWAQVAIGIADKAGVSNRLSWGSADSGASDYESAIAAAEYLGPRSDTSFDDPTHILYTSGTSGKPKGALSTQGTLVWQALNTAHTSRHAESDNHHLNPMPLFHAGGLATTSNPILYFGGAVSTMRRFLPADVLAALTTSEVPITHFGAIPLMYRGISEAPNFDTADFSHARLFLVAGAIAEPELLQLWADRGVALQPQYGGTEHGPMATAVDEPARWLEKSKSGSTGRKALHTELRLVDSDGTDVPEGATGEIWLRGPSVTVGYWGKDNADYFTDGWYRTGDAARRDSDGFYYPAGRVKEMYKSGGENVYPAEIERVLAVHPKVADVAVLGIPDEKWGEVGLAVVIPAGDVPPTLEELNSYASERLARFKLPKSLVLASDLPRNVTGKVSRAGLKEHYGGI